jgi:hypothetical protein
MRLRHGTAFIYDDATGDIMGLRDPDGSDLFLVPRLGVFFATNSQTDGSGAVPMTFTTQALSRGVTLVDSSKIYVDRDGVYEFQLSTHIHNTDSQAHSFELWGRLNGIGVSCWAGLGLSALRCVKRYVVGGDAAILSLAITHAALARVCVCPLEVVSHMK